MGSAGRSTYAIRRRVKAGMVAGLAGTCAMTAVMLVAKRVGMLGVLPPRQVVHRAMNGMGLSRSRQTEALLTAGAHLTYGMLSGAVFNLGANRIRFAAPVATGIAYGALLWTASYLGWVPALGLMRPAASDRPGKPTAVVLAHLVFGAVLGALLPREAIRRN